MSSSWCSPLRSVPSHSGAPYFLIRFFYCRRILGEPVKQNAHARFIKEIQNAVSSLSHYHI